MSRMPVDAARSVPTAGGRTRAGNGMSRARSGILAGAATCVARYGTRKTTMGDIAREGGVAKATLYNHFRTKDDVLAALVAAEVERLVEMLDALPGQPGSPTAVVEALACAATFVSDHAVVRALAATEPGLVAAFASPGTSELWLRAVGVARGRLSLAQAAGSLHARHETEALVTTALRWVLAHALWPAPADEVRAGAYRLVHGLVAAPQATIADEPVAAAEAVPEVREREWSASGLQAG
ncbi:MAG TPA: helix-turn-helix domain-containing protein [Mycobacteriales bacterium]|nr:helix-turn-helix domain-containing protein [Mycobacteriales bacterium]